MPSCAHGHPTPPVSRATRHDTRARVSSDHDSTCGANAPAATPSLSQHSGLPAMKTALEGSVGSTHFTPSVDSASRIWFAVFELQTNAKCGPSECDDVIRRAHVSIHRRRPGCRPERTLVGCSDTCTSPSAFSSRISAEKKQYIDLRAMVFCTITEKQRCAASVRKRKHLAVERPPFFVVRVLCGR